MRAYANLANEMAAAGYSDAEARRIKAEVDHYEKVREEVKLGSGDAIDMKLYEPAMRHLLDTYIHAEESEKLSAFDDMTLVELIVERGEQAIESLPKGIRENPEAIAETIENNVRKLIIDESAGQPQVLREDVGVAGCPDPAAEEGGDGLQDLPGEGRGTDEEGEQAGEPHVVSGRHQ